MKIKSLMNKNVQTIEPSRTVRQAAQKMTEYGIGSLVVVKDKKLAGIITERDILVKVVAKGRYVSEKVATVMTKNVIYVDPDIDVEEAIKIMTENRIKKLPVVSGAVLLGIVSVIDLLKAEPKMLEKLAAVFMTPKKIVAG